MSNVTLDKNTLSFLSSMMESLRAFFRWWFAELAFLVPERLPAIFAKKHKPSVVFEYSHSTIKVFHRSMDSCDFIGEISCKCTESEITDGRLSSWLQDTAVHLKTILSIPENRVVRKEIALPRIAVDNLDEVLKYELDRHTPFRADQAYYDYVISHKTSSSELINVIVYAVAKTFVNDLLSTMKNLGVETPHIIVAADLRAADPLAGKAEIRMYHDEPVRSLSANRLNIALSGALCALVAAALLVPVYKMEKTVNDLKIQLSDARKEVEVINKTRNDINGYVSTLKVLKEEKVTSSNVVDVLLELTAILPDDTWLEKFSMNAGQVKFQGQTASSPELIRLLESSEIFNKVKFESPVIQSQGGASERFSIVAEIKKDNGDVN